MNVTQVSLLPTEEARHACRPALTPELLAASGARYSRNNEGLDSILAKIDPDNMDRSVDTIFRLIDYGHQSIADMVPVAIFMDQISIWLAYYVWSLCPLAGGQESSTRYIKIDAEALISPGQLGIPEEQQAQWQSRMEAAFEAYRCALTTWEALGEQHPSLMSIPSETLEDERARKTVDRMKRNYRFDRARYYLPVAAATNMMMVMSARSWAKLCQHLCSYPLPEAQALGEALRVELAIAAPRLLKHSGFREGIAAGLRNELKRWQSMTSDGCPPTLRPGCDTTVCDPDVFLDVTPPPDVKDSDFADDLQWHDNRYAWIGTQLQRTIVRCRWSAVSMGEIRDMNRHRTGSRYCPLVPVGFYAALEQLPALSEKNTTLIKTLRDLTETGRQASEHAFVELSKGDPAFVYSTLLGTQYAFERLTHADKFIYEAELRTGLGAHFRYAKHYKDALVSWYKLYPETRGLILEGDAEPE